MKKVILGIVIVLVLLLGAFQLVNSQSTAIIELIPNDEGTGGEWFWVATPTARLITTTPLPTYTPWIITATPSDVPTQEIFTPTFTHTPENSPTPTFTPSPTPDADACYGTVVVDNLRIRASYPDGNTIGYWANGARVQINQFALVDVATGRIDEWVEVLGTDRDGNFKLGWSAALYSFNRYIRIDLTQVCSDLEFPEPQAALLWHAVPSFNIDNARTSYGIFFDKKIDYGLKIYGDMGACLDALLRLGTCIYRHPNVDYPQNIGSSNPRTSARQYFADYGQPVCNILRDYDKAYWEVVNEPNLGSTLSDSGLTVTVWWNDWTDEMITQAQAYGCPKLVLLTGGPGHGEQGQYRVWRDMLNRAASFGYLLGEHAYTPYHDDGLCACDQWLACRHRTNQAYRVAEGVDIKVAITEAARGWGNDPVSVADFVCWYAIIKQDAWVHSVALWTAGFHPIWPNANLDNYMVVIATQIDP